MWLGLRYLAVSMPSDKAILSELGVGDEVKDTAKVIRYKRLHREFPNIKLGPDESISNHLKRLENARRGLQDDRSAEPSIPAFTLNNADPEGASWVTGPKPSRKSDLLARDPGWYTSPPSAVDSRYGVPPETLPQREPGATIPNHGQPGAGYAPDSQSMLDWVNWLRGKGISVNHSLQVPNAARPEDMPTYRPHGRDLAEEFSRPANPEPAVPGPDEIDNRLLLNQKGRAGLNPSLLDRIKGILGPRRASTIVTSYIEGVLVGLGEKLPKVASLEDKMGELGWSYHRSGSGNWFQHPNIGGNVHILEQQPGGGWIHNYGPSEDEMVADPPIEYPDLKEAFLHIHGDGQLQVPYKPRPQLPTSRMN